jgi:hypothetical protein
MEKSTSLVHSYEFLGDLYFVYVESCYILIQRLYII